MVDLVNIFYFLFILFFIFPKLYASPPWFKCMFGLIFKSFQIYYIDFCFKFFFSFKNPNYFIFDLFQIISLLSDSLENPWNLNFKNKRSTVFPKTNQYQVMNSKKCLIIFLIWFYNNKLSNIFFVLTFILILNRLRSRVLNRTCLLPNSVLVVLCFHMLSFFSRFLTIVINNKMQLYGRVKIW